ncbi:MAG: extracellular solute-binding protein [Spirochaetota bacterium]
MRNVSASALRAGIGGLLALLSVALLAGCGGSAEQAGKLFIYNWTYYIPDEVIEAFEEEYGVDVVYDVFASNEEMFAKLKAGGTGYDIAFPSGDYVSIMANEEMLLEIDRSRLTNWGNLDESVLAKIAYDPGNRWSVPYMMGAAGIAVNTEYVSDYERSWSIFAREDLRGRMTMLDDMREVLGGALSYLGYSVNTTNEAELAAARDLVTEWSENLLRFDAEAFGKAFANGEVWVVQGYQENVFLELDESEWEKVDFFIPEEGGSMYMDSMVLLKDAKNIDVAYQFMDYILEAQVMAEIADYLGLPSINVPARALMQTVPRYQISDLDAAEFKEDLGLTIDRYNQAWQEIRVGG